MSLVVYMNSRHFGDWAASYWCKTSEDSYRWIKEINDSHPSIIACPKANIGISGIEVLPSSNRKIENRHKADSTIEG
jgi:hypothetical protein